VGVAEEEEEAAPYLLVAMAALANSLFHILDLPS
jgi:hypothetical protein